MLSQPSSLSRSKQATNYKEGLTPVLTLLTEGARHHRHIRRYIKAQVSDAPTPSALSLAGSRRPARRRPPSLATFLFAPFVMASCCDLG